MSSTDQDPFRQNSSRRRRRSGPDEDEENGDNGQQMFGTDSKRLSTLQDQAQQQQNVNAGYTSMLL